MDNADSIRNYSPSNKIFMDQHDVVTEFTDNPNRHFDPQTMRKQLANLKERVKKEESLKKQFQEISRRKDEELGAIKGEFLENAESL